MVKDEQSGGFLPELGHTMPACPVPGVPLGRLPLTREELCSTPAYTPGPMAHVFQDSHGPLGYLSDLCT